MRWDLILFLILLVLHLVLYAFAEDPDYLSTFGNTMQAIALLFAATQFTRSVIPAGREEAHQRLLMAIGFWVCLAGHALLSYSELVLEKPSIGTVTDVIWLVGYLLIARSIQLTSERVFTRQEIILRYPAIAVTTGIIVFLVLWRPLFDPERDLAVKFFQATFPFVDLMIASLAFLLARRSRDKSWQLAGWGSLVIGTADLIFPFFHTMSSPVFRYMDIPLFAGYSLWWLMGSSWAKGKAPATNL